MLKAYGEVVVKIKFAKVLAQKMNFVFKSYLIHVIFLFIGYLLMDYTECDWLCYDPVFVASLFSFFISGFWYANAFGVLIAKNVLTHF